MAACASWDVTFLDGFCGCGGSTHGLHQIPGVRVVMAINHDPLAVATHNHNNPETDHDCADLSLADFRYYPATDVIWVSPDCTDHTQSKSLELRKGEQADRSRATMFDLPRALETGIRRGKPYKAFIVENVVEVNKWIFMNMWRIGVLAADYCIHEICFNSAHAQAGGDPAPQSRDRWYCVGHLKSLPCPDLDKWMRPRAHCPRCDMTVSAIQVYKDPTRTWGKYGTQYLWHCPACTTVVEPAVLPAASAIDPTDLGIRLGDKPVKDFYSRSGEYLGQGPLAPKTMHRIDVGRGKLERGEFVAPALIVPMEGRDHKRPMDAAEPFRTFTTRAENGLMFDPRMVPFISSLRGGGSLDSARSVLETAGTITAGGNHHLLVVPPGFNADGRGQGSSLFDLMQALDWPEPQGRIDIEDCRVRMLQPREQMNAMAFSPDFEMLPNTSKRKMTRLAGQAVTPPVARDLGCAVVEMIRGESIELAPQFLELSAA